MKYVLLILLHLLIGQRLIAQEFYLLSGKNYSQYKTDDQIANSVLAQGNQLFSLANSYELGYQSHPFSPKLSYSLGLTYDQYDLQYALSGSSFLYQWDLHYIGLKNTFQVQLFRSRADHSGPFSIHGQGGATIASFLAGNVKSKDNITSLLSNNDFNKTIFQPFVGVKLNYQVMDQLTLTGGYQFATSSIANISYKNFVLNTHYYSFGILFPICKK